MTADNYLSRRSVLRTGALAAGGLVVAGSIGSAVGQQGQGSGRCARVVPDDYGSIQQAVDAADPGDTICVRQGTYDEDVTVDTQVTLRGHTAPHSNTPATLDGQLAIEPGGDGTTVRRLRITPAETFAGGSFPDPAGVRITASDVTVERNLIEDLTADLGNGAGTLTLHGVQVFGADGASVADVTVRENVIRGFENRGDSTTWPKYGGVAGVKAQADVSGVTITGNRVSDHHSAGWVYGVVLTPSASAPGVPTTVTVEDNHLAGLNDGTGYDVFTGPNDGRDVAPYPGSAVGIDGTADADEATVRHNNLLAPNGAESKDQTGTLTAECNWWGDRSGPRHASNPDGTGTVALERGSATIATTPWLIAPAPSNACRGGRSPGGGDGHGNGV